MMLTCAGHEAVDLGVADAANVGTLQDFLHRRRRQHVVAEHAEVFELLLLGVPDHDRGRRRRGLEADREEYDFVLGVFFRDPHAMAGLSAIRSMRRPPGISRRAFRDKEVIAP